MTYKEALWTVIAAVSFLIWVLTGETQPVIVGCTALIMSKVDAA